MATFFFGVNGPTLDFRHDLGIADADAPRIMGYLMSSSFGTVTENIVSEEPDASWSPDEKAGETEKDRPMLQTQAWVTRQASPEETAANYAKAILAQLLEQTVAFERAQAAKVAAESVAPIQVAA
jgi:hypothetical protein